jgi:hypothetical protein
MGGGRSVNLIWGGGCRRYKKGEERRGNGKEKKERKKEERKKKNKKRVELSVNYVQMGYQIAKWYLHEE